MEIQIDFVDDVGVVSVKGSMDALTAPSLTQFFTEQIGEGHVQLVVNLKELEYTSSAGLRALLGAVKEARQQGGDLRLADIQTGVQKVLDLSGFSSILKLYTDVDLAVESYS
jgi:anti-anti-sigma factor